MLLLIKGAPLNGQRYYFDNYNVEQGLGQSKVYTIIQSRSHQIWIGTKSGATRFDGITFYNYTSEDGLAEKQCKSYF
ncbi:MAG: hypothetical protein HC830_11385 [Bacteroidetes bacterium]|nr:hypothetical protein [Bacteroidota bacterium]